MTIIFLNGAGSAGKSSIAKAIQFIATEPYMVFSFDAFFNMMPPTYIVGGKHAEKGFNFAPYEKDGKPAIHCTVGEEAKKLIDTMPNLARMLADNGCNLIIDEILFGDEQIKSYQKALKEHMVYFVAVHCKLESMEERELLRGDRAIGLARDQVDRVHAGYRPYDFEVDTTENSSFDCARAIMEFIKNTPKPRGLSH